MNDPRRNTEIAKIHVGKKALGLDDETYRTMLFTLTGKYSAAALDADGRRKVIESMKEDGAFDDRDAFTRAWDKIRAGIPEYEEETGGDRHKALYLAAWHWLGDGGHLTSPFWELAGRTSFVTRVTGLGHLSFATPGDVNKLVEAVKGMVRRAVNRQSGRPPR